MSSSLLSDLRLGDVLRLPDGRMVTCRAKVVLPLPVLSMVGFVVCGELATLAGFEALGGVGWYVRVALSREQLTRVSSVYEGVCSYWPPNQPAKAQAMGELRWRVCEMPGRRHPLVILWRAGEPACFVRNDGFAEGDLSRLALPADNEDVSAVDRVAAKVVHPDTAIPDLAPQRRRVPLPLRRSR